MCWVQAGRASVTTMMMATMMAIGAAGLAANTAAMATAEAGAATMPAKALVRCPARDGLHHGTLRVADEMDAYAASPQVPL